MAQPQTETQLSRKIFYDSNMLRALKNAQEYAGKEGYVLSMPQLLQERTANLNNEELWSNWFTTLSEENSGIDTKGRFGKKDSPVVVITHGCGFLKPYSSEDEISSLLEGKLPGNIQIPIFAFKQFNDKSQNLPKRYGVAIDFETAASLESVIRDIDGLKENPLVIARAGGIENAMKYFEAIRTVYGARTLRNEHLFKHIHPKEAQGHLLCVGNYYEGGNLSIDLRNGACFVSLGNKSKK